MTDPTPQQPEQPPAAPSQPEATAAETPTATPSFENLSASTPASGAHSASLDTLLGISVDVSIRFGRSRMTVQEVLNLGPGSVVQLDRMVGEPIDVFVSDRKFAEGEIVVIGDHFGVRLTKVTAPNAAVNAV